MQATPALSDIFPSTTAKTDTASRPDELGQEDFLELMVAQLENQDPTKPMDNFEFLAQIAQFGTVEGIQGMQKGFDELASVLYDNQTLQAASLVGNKVVTESNLGVLGAEEPLNASIQLRGNSSEVRMFVQDMSGRLVHSRTLGAAAAGELNFSWNGVDDSGGLAPPGSYRVSADAVIGGKVEAASVYAHSLVESVTIDQAAGAVRLNLAGGNQVSLNEVKSFL